MKSRPLPGPDALLLIDDKIWIAQALTAGIAIVDIDTYEIVQYASWEEPDETELILPDDFWRDPITGDLYITEVSSPQLVGGGVVKLAPDGTRTRILQNFGDGSATPNGIAGVHRPGEPVQVYIGLVSSVGAPTGVFEIDPSGVSSPTLVYGAHGGVVLGAPIAGASGITFDDAGAELYVPVAFGGAVLAIDVDAHTARTVWTGAGHKGVTLKFNPGGTALLYSEQDTGRLLRLDPAGPPDQVPELVAQLEPGLDGVAIVPDGRIFTSNPLTGGLAVVHPDGEIDHPFRRTLNVPMGVVRLADGRYAVGDFSLTLVDEDPIGNSPPLRIKYYIDGDFTFYAAPGDDPCDIYVGAWIRRTIQHVDLCNIVPNQATNLIPPLTLAFPSELLLVGDTLFVADAYGLIWALPGIDGATPTVAVPFAYGLATPIGLAYADGVLYVTEFAASRVRRIDVATGATLGFLTELSGPEGVAVESDGAVLVVESTAGRLTRVLPDGSRETVIDGLATNMSTFGANPWVEIAADVAVTDEGSILFTEPVTGTLTEITYED